MTRLLSTLSALALVVAAPAAAHAQLLDFEDLGGNAYVPASYHGFTFDGGSGPYSWVSTGIYSSFPSNSGSLATWSNGGASLTIGRATPFTLGSAVFSARNGSCASAGAATQTVNGYLAGSLVATQTFALDCAAYQTVAFNFANVDFVRFEVVAPMATNLLVDDIQFGAVTATPEPASLALLGTGLLGLGGVAVRRKRARVA